MSNASQSLYWQSDYSFNNLHHRYQSPQPTTAVHTIHPIAILIVSIPLALIGLIAVPLALSQSHWLWRLTSLYGLTFFLGASIGLMTVSQEQSYVVILGMGLMAAGMSRSPSAIQIGLATVGVIFWLGSAWFIAFGNAYLHQIDMRWIARVTVYVIAVSGAAMVLRLLGYRIIKLFPRTVMTQSRALMERDFDDWFRLLEQSPGDDHSSQELHGRLRESGLDSMSATLVSNAYARLTGLIPIGKTFDGRLELVQREAELGWFWQSLEQLRGFRFSIGQLFVTTTAAATLFAFLRFFAKGFPTHEDLVFGPPILCVLCVVSLSIAMAELGLPPRRRAMQRCVFTVAIAAVGTPALLRSLGLGILPSTLVSVVTLTVAACLFVGFSVMRQHGYRLIQIRHIKPPSSVH